MKEDLAKELAEHFDTWHVPGRYEELRAAFAERSAEEMAELMPILDEMFRKGELSPLEDDDEEES